METMSAGATPKTMAGWRKLGRTACHCRVVAVIEEGHAVISIHADEGVRLEPHTATLEGFAAFMEGYAGGRADHAAPAATGGQRAGGDAES